MNLNNNYEKDLKENDKKDSKGEKMSKNDSKLNDVKKEGSFSRSEEKDKKKNKYKKVCIIVIVILSIILVLALAYVIYLKFIKKDVSAIHNLSIDTDDFNFNIIDKNSDTRPYAVMIGNTEEAWPQYNVNEAMVVYEMPVEAGISRIMAVFKDKPNLEKIGPLRSARHYFLDYVKEYDAIFVHEGHSPRAESEINSRNIDSVEYTDGLFYRDETKLAPHNAISSSERILNSINANNFSLTTKTKTPLKYSLLPVKFKDSISATIVEAGYSEAGDLKLKYNEETKKYEKYEFDQLLKDGATDEPLAATNIMILRASTTLLTGFGEGSGRVHVETDRELSGYYFTEGEGVKIKANKETVDSQTIYTLEDGTELKINDGNTFIFIIPDTQNIEIKGDKKVNEQTENTNINGEKLNLEEETKLESKKLEELLKEKNIKIIREVK